MQPNSISAVIPYGEHSHSCGYCHSDTDTSHSYGIWANSLTCLQCITLKQDYQRLIDRGWRRSGHYVYKPNMRSTCCPMYTIRLDANKFSPSKAQRKVLNKFRRYMEGGCESKDGSAMQGNITASKSKSPASKSPASKPLSLRDLVHFPEKVGDQKHRFQIELEPSSYSDEKYNVYCRYQIAVHHDDPSELSQKSFRRFLVNSPLIHEKVAGRKGHVDYGSFHQKYLLDGKLIAVAVIDILPECVSSVYFLYDPDYASLALGKYSALREISLAQELSEQSEPLRWYYMGYYIHSCPKMVYKGQYSPSDLLDPETYTWFPLEQCRPWLDQHKFVVFSDPENDEHRDESRQPPGWLDPTTITDKDIHSVMILIDDHGVVPASMIKSSQLDDLLREYIAAVGKDLARDMVLALF